VSSGRPSRGGLAAQSQKSDRPFGFALPQTTEALLGPQPQRHPHGWIMWLCAPPLSLSRLTRALPCNDPWPMPCSLSRLFHSVHEIMSVLPC
jgi:hypothetical protein